MLNAFRKLQKDEHGQAIVIAAVGMLIMAIGVLATAQIGYAIYERQKLQTIADATVYSLATMHARAYNFFAFTNRAMAVHYVAMMHMQGIISQLTLYEALFGSMSDLFNDIYSLGCCIPECFCACWTWAQSISQAMNGVKQSISPVIDALDPTFSQATSALFQINQQTLYRSQQVYKYAMYMINGTGMLQVASQSDPDIDVGVSRLVSGVINTLVWSGLFDSGSEGLPLPTGAAPENQKAQRIATEIANASRDPAYVTSRSMTGSAPVIGSLIGGSATGIHGQSKFITDQDPKYIQQKNYYNSELAEGVAMTSADTLSIGNISSGGFDMGKLGGCGSFFSPAVSVQHAPMQKGQHVRYHQGNMGSGCGGPLYCPEYKHKSGDSNHNNWQGPAAYISLKPGNVRDAGHDFGQHGVFIWLNKKTKKLTRESLTQKFTLHAPGYTTGIDTRIGEDSLLSKASFTGINAIAAAQVYYHRPGNWREQPNLFNPYWRARLYPTAQFINNWLIGADTLPAEIKQLLDGFLLIH
jgi:hypothetical protein